MPVLKMLMI